MKPRSTKYNLGWRGTTQTVAGQGALQNSSNTIPEVCIRAAHSIEELVDEVECATEQGFERHGTAYFDGEQDLPFRQVMVRYGDALAPAKYFGA